MDPPTLPPSGVRLPSPPSPLPVPTPSAPTLPDAAPYAAGAVAPPGGTTQQHGRHGLTAAQIAAMEAGAARAAVPPTGRSVVSRIMLSLVLLAVAAGWGAAARVAADRRQSDEPPPGMIDALPPLGAQLPDAPIDRPALRYADVVVIAADGWEVAAHVDVAASQLDGARWSVQADGTPLGVEWAVRGAGNYERHGGSTNWLRVDDGGAQAVAAWTYRIGTLTDIVPPEALPYVTLLEQSVQTSPNTPLRANPKEPLPRLEGRKFRHYRVAIDSDAFRAADAIAHSTWSLFQDYPDGIVHLELWVDDFGMVRRLTLDRSGATEVFELRAYGVESDLDFQPISEGS